LFSTQGNAEKEIESLPGFKCNQMRTTQLGANDKES